jgi:MscS family membrane protein
MLSRFFSSTEDEAHSLIRRIVTGPLVLIGTLFVGGWVLSELGVGIFAQKILESHTLLIFAFIWAFWIVISLIKKYQQDKLTKQGKLELARMVQPITTLFRWVVVLFGLLFWLNNIGVNITTVLAGLGIGGLAVALALQKPIEDMMGTFSIFSQRTIRIGDFCGYGTITGVVEDIGLRATRLRTLTNTVVSIPNSRVAYAEIENFTAREKFRYWPKLRLRYDTTATQLRAITGSILEMLNQHDRVHDDSPWVRFTSFGDDAKIVTVSCFVKTTDYQAYLEVAEDINYRIEQIVQDAGAVFALPGQSIYLDDQGAGDPPVKKISPD